MGILMLSHDVRDVEDQQKLFSYPIDTYGWFLNCVSISMLHREERANWRALVASFVCGGTFASGLVLSGMVKRAKVIDFLALRYVLTYLSSNVAIVCRPLQCCRPLWMLLSDPTCDLVRPSRFCPCPSDGRPRCVTCSPRSRCCRSLQWLQRYPLSCASNTSAHHAEILRSFPRTS